MEFKSVPFHQASLYIGCVEGYHGNPYTEDDLRNAIGEFQASQPKDELVSLRVTPTRFVVGSYDEHGWEITAINYPRFPKPKIAINNFIFNLAKFLIKKFNQNRISIVTPDEIMMLESEEAEQKH